MRCSACTFYKLLASQILAYPAPPQALDHTSRGLRALGVHTSPTAGLLEATRHSSAKAAHAASAAAGFDAVMRRAAANPNTLMESAHLKAFYDGEYRHVGAYDAIMAH